MRAQRLVSLVLVLQTRGAVGAADLARELGVSVRTVHRDAEALRAAGIPVVGERGPAGGYRLPGGYRTRLTGLTAEEAEALFLGVPAGDLGLAPALADAQLKLLAALPPSLRARADRTAELFHVERDGWWAAGPPPAHLPALAAALWAGRRARVVHRGRERQVDPLGLVLKGRVWYLVAGTPGGVRTFRADRLAAAAELEAPVRRPPDFDLAAFWAGWSAEFAASLPLVDVRVRVQPGALEALRAAVDIRARDDVPAAIDGAAELVVRFERLEFAESGLLRVGAGVEVLGPPELRARIAGHARALAALYATDEPPGVGGS
jgi:predicted DNA-binding transcriptional regulator YafY